MIVYKKRRGGIYTFFYKALQKSWQELFCKMVFIYNFEITFKELFGFDDKGNFSKLKNKLSKVYNLKKDKIVFLKHKDYNLYYMPDNNVYTKYLI